MTKSLRDKQEERRRSKVEDISTTKASLNKDRRRGRLCYNSRPAYMRVHGLNAASAKEEWPSVKAEPQEQDFLRGEATRFTKEGASWLHYKEWPTYTGLSGFPV